MMIALSTLLQQGKDYYLPIPDVILSAANLKIGDRVTLEVVDNSIHMRKYDIMDDDSDDTYFSYIEKLEHVAPEDVEVFVA